MLKKIKSLVGEKAIKIAYTDKPVTAWGGMVLFSGIAQKIGLEKALRKALPFNLNAV